MKHVIGVTGGIGSGKSYLTTLLKETYGAQVFLTDTIAQKLMEPSNEGYEALLHRYGTSLLDACGLIQKEKMSNLLFQEGQKQEIDQLIHPLVWGTIKRCIKESTSDFVVIESAVIGMEQTVLFDEIWFVYTEKETRINRLMQTRGYTRQKAEEVINHQVSDEEYRKISQREIDNNGSLQQIAKQISILLRG